MDIAPELLKEIQEDFNKQLEQNQRIAEIQSKIDKGVATYKEANEYAIEVGEMLASAFQNNLSSAVLPNGRMYYNIAQKVIRPNMLNNYDLVTAVTNNIQAALNKAANIGIKAITPQLNEDKVDGIVRKVSNAEQFDDVAAVLNEPIVTFTQSIIDDAIKANAEFQSKAGLQPKIVRTMAGGCCKWCQEVAGTYRYPDEVPKDVYRRHQNCRCTVEFHPKDGKVQNVHSKEWRKESVYDRIKLSKKLEKKDTIKKLLKLNSEVTVSIPPRKIDVNVLSFNSNHINIERSRKITKEDAVSWINNSLFSVTVWNGKFERYFSFEGAVYVDLNQNEIRTAYGRERYTQNLVDCLEVF